MMTRRTTYLLTSAATLLVATLFASCNPGAREPIGCPTCGPQVSISGTFAHRREAGNLVIQGAGDNAAACLEEINGKEFTVSIAA
ncbi:MAG TPA: hypothetical protein VHM90_12555 [Phycisphaerae bacterium]|nr:hypothetical protein [Phycisphaerae bacterium]